MPEVIKFDDVTGESKYPGFETWIELTSWNWTITHPTSGLPGGGYSQDRARVHDISVTKFGDKATIALIKKILFAKHFPKVEIASLKTTGDKIEPYMKIELEDVIITSLNQHGGGTGTPSESMNLSCKTIKWTYQPQTAGGSLDPEDEVKIDLESHQSV